MTQMLPPEPLDDLAHQETYSSRPWWRSSTAAIAGTVALLLLLVVGGYVAATSGDEAVRLAATAEAAESEAADREAAVAKKVAEVEALEERAAKAAADLAAVEQAAAEKAAEEKAAAEQAAADSAAAEQAAAQEAAAEQAAADKAAAGKTPAGSATPTKVTAAAPESKSATESYDRAYALELGERIVRDIKTVDERVGDGIAVGGALRLLAGNYERLESLGAPPKTDAGTYLARVNTLADFSSRAADDYDNGSASEGLAKYEVLRDETGPLFSSLNAALGSNLALPAR